MDYGDVAVFLIIAGAIGGFIVLARELLRNWKLGSKGHEEADARQSVESEEFQRCFKDCLSKERWDPDKGEFCASVCRTHVGMPLAA